MNSGWFKSLLVAVFSIILMGFFNEALAQHGDHNSTHAPEEKKGGFDVKTVLFEHVLDAHEFHFMSWEGKDGIEHSFSIPLPVILYSPQKGLSLFMSSKFHHGQSEVNGYRLIDDKVVPVDPSVKVYDLSLTRNVVQMLLAMIILVWLMIGIARKYSKGNGVTSAPKGWQNAIEPVVTFVRDEIAKPNLGSRYSRYMPFLLTVFFFILINNIIGLIPGTANVTGNIAFTLVLGVISFIVILISSNGHYWKHIFWPPVPHGIKPIMIIVEFMSIFTKPFALIIRLFANMLAGHIIIFCLIALIFIFGNLNRIAGWGFTPISIGFSVFIYFIEILVAFLQAYIFTNLTAVFVGQALEGSHDGDHGGDAVVI
jgi:F-type H+-transporting ATPase subunit a